MECIWLAYSIKYNCSEFGNLDMWTLRNLELCWDGGHKHFKSIAGLTIIPNDIITPTNYNIFNKPHDKLIYFYFKLNNTQTVIFYQEFYDIKSVTISPFFCRGWMIPAQISKKY